MQSAPVVAGVRPELRVLAELRVAVVTAARVVTAGQPPRLARPGVTAVRAATLEPLATGAMAVLVVPGH